MDAFCDTSCPPLLEVRITSSGDIQQHGFVSRRGPGTSCPKDKGKENIDFLARFYLCEAFNERVEQSLRDVGLHPPPTFAELHARDTISLPILNTCPEACYLAKWSAPVLQTRRHWAIERRILAQKPYDIDTIRDPLDLRLNHTRYERSPSSQHRVYHPITISDDEEHLDHAAVECVSFYFERIQGTTVGFLLFDPPRLHRLTRMEYQFWFDGDASDTSTDEDVFVRRRRCRDRFLDKLRTHPISSLQHDAVTAIKSILLEIIQEDEANVLAKMNESLDHIGLTLARDDLLSKEVAAWRDRLCRWRNLLFHSRNSINYLCSEFDSWRLGAEDGTMADWWPPSLPNRLKSLQNELQCISSRIDGTFHALMSTMSIVESARAINEAETVSKLTHLAFFFVPISLVTSAFSTNIAEFKDRLACWHWVVTSMIVITLTYLFLYQDPISRFIVKSPGLLADMSFNRLSKVAIRWLTIARSTWRATPYLLIFVSWLGLNAGIATGLWKLIESPVSLGGKIGVSLAVMSGFLITALIPLILRYSQKRSRSLAVMIVGSTVVGLLLMAAMGLGLWKLLDSPIAIGGKAISCFALLCYSSLMSVIPTIMTRRKRAPAHTVTPDSSSI